MTASTTYGPPELRIKWEPDPEVPDLGDCDDAAGWAAVDAYGVDGCTVEIRKPACACCGVKTWEHAASLWGVIGDDAYHREIERELVAEAMA